MQAKNSSMAANKSMIGTWGKAAVMEKENTVVVQATTSDGTILAEVFTTVNTSELGGAGPWSVQLSVVVPAGTTGQIIAFSPDPKTGGNVAFAQINVVYGQQ